MDRHSDKEGVMEAMVPRWKGLSTVLARHTNMVVAVPPLLSEQSGMAWCGHPNSVEERIGLGRVLGKNRPREWYPALGHDAD